MKSLVIVFGAILLVIFLPQLFVQIDDALSSPFSETHASITTAANVTSANITLGQDVFMDAITSIESVSSNGSSDSPTPSTYNSTTRLLTVSGLAGGQTRALTVNSLIDNPNLPAAMLTYIPLLRWFLLFIIIGLCLGAVYAFFHT